jgi:catechol 2,3-dioxygenase-like lactoylglutathione lyase family enzyme
MLDNARIGANVPVSNLDQAISFYEGKLGLRLFERGEGEPYARSRAQATRNWGSTRARALARAAIRWRASSSMTSGLQ